VTENGKRNWCVDGTEEVTFQKIKKHLFLRGYKVDNKLQCLVNLFCIRRCSCLSRTAIVVSSHSVSFASCNHRMSVVCVCDACRLFYLPACLRSIM